jgi:hypothetical protein
MLSSEIIFLNVEINVRSVQDSHMTVQVVMFVYQLVRFVGLLWLKVLFAGLLGEKNTAEWLLIWLNSSNEQGDIFKQIVYSAF